MLENIEKKDLILAAARELIEKFGFSSLTMDKVAGKAGIAKGTIYLYFKDKNELMESVLQKGFERMFERIGKKINESDSCKDKLKALIHENLSYINENRFFFKTVFLDETNVVFLKKKSIESFNLRRKRYANFISDIIINGIESGEFKQGISALKCGYLLIALIKTTAIYNFLNDDSEDSENSKNLQESIKSDSVEIFNLFMYGIANC